MIEDILVQVLPGQAGNIGHLLLNRPKALNALSFKMCQTIHSMLQQWQHDSTIKGVIIEGAGERAFCAGGDVRSIYALREKPAQALQFFQEEYAMNQALFHFNKPYVAWLDGITMGGGVGVSIYGSHRVATERFSFAMPETLIGFFPDIGAGYFLNRCPHFVGYYLGLVGATIGAADALDVGLVTQVIPQEARNTVVSLLQATPFGANPRQTVTNLLNQFAQHPGQPALAAFYDGIAACFSQPSIQEIFLALEAWDTAWSRQVVDQLQQRSPTSLVVSLEYLQRCQSLAFDDVMQLNLQLVQAFMQSHDFFEGVRAVLIDKDQKPSWNPDEVPSNKILTQYFQPSR